MKNLYLVAVSAIAMAVPAQAAKVYNVSAVYASTATYNGTVTFADDYQSMLATSGTLKGYAEGSFNFSSLADSSVVNWVWPSGNNGNVNYSGDPAKFATFLMTGVEPGFGSFVVFSALTSGAPALSFSDSAYANSINYNDALVSGSVTLANVPEPASWALMIGGFGLAGAAMRRRRSVTVRYA